MQLQRRLAAVAAVGAAGCAILYAATTPAPAIAPSGNPAPPAAAVAAVAADGAGKPGARRVYPYSVVPGGVSGVRELGRVLREDKVVAAHYAEFDLAKAHEKTVDKPRAVHVSYRKGDKVYWTAKKVMLAEGETLLSDGTHEARARCANRISDTPRFPVEAHGPSEAELDAAMLDDGAEGSLENVSFALTGDDGGEGRPGGFLNAPGNGRAGAIPGASADAHASTSTLFAAGTAGPAQGAYLTRRTAGARSGSGEAGGAPGSDTAPAGGGSAGGSAGSTNPVADDSQAPGGSATPQPGTPWTPQQPGNGGGPTPGSPGETPPTPDLPDLPDLPVIPAPGIPGGGQDTDPLPGVPAQPPTDAGTVPVPGGTPGESPLPDPTVTPPVAPVQPDREDQPPTEVPEPASLWLFGAALAALLLQRYRAARRR
ncbi:MAG: PEP-CTERM sorting domain-containing protein [Janthinobacterium lividum]